MKGCGPQIEIEGMGILRVANGGLVKGLYGEGRDGWNEAASRDMQTRGPAEDSSQCFQLEAVARKPSRADGDVMYRIDKPTAPSALNLPFAHFDPHNTTQ